MEAMDIEAHARQQLFIEKVGLLFEQVGIPRMAGRILGWLLICDPPQQSAQQLGDVLNASKGSISSMTRYLVMLGIVGRISLPGERRTMYQIQASAWRNMIRAKMAVLGEFRLLAEAGLATLSDDPEQRQRLEAMRDVYGFFEREMPALMAQWDSQEE